MAITGSPRDRGVYDDRRLYEKFMKWGAAANHKKLRDWCVRVGMFNPEIGRPSQMGPFWAVWRYALENADKPGVFELYREWWFESDPRKRIPTMRHFLENIKFHSYDRKSVASRTKYEKFCEEHKLPILPDKTILEREFELRNTVFDRANGFAEVAEEVYEEVG